MCPVDSLAHLGDLSSVFGMLWRFLPLVDPQVSVMVSRDLDSRLTAREQAAVEDWLETGLSFHVMRDHISHSKEILAGMWGARLDTGDRSLMTEAMLQLIDQVRFARASVGNDFSYFQSKGKGWVKGMDQRQLESFLWPVVSKISCVHDSYLCQRYQSQNWRPFPTQRLEGAYNFVGAAGPMEIKTKCPEACRPEDHPDWTFC